MTDLGIYKEALHLACVRIADGYQEYHEANTPEGWAQHFLDLAAKEKEQV